MAPVAPAVAQLMQPDATPAVSFPGSARIKI
jgi:hypothetical protein